jgi:hypothetical protein
MPDRRVWPCNQLNELKRNGREVFQQGRRSKFDVETGATDEPDGVTTHNSGARSTRASRVPDRAHAVGTDARHRAASVSPGRDLAQWRATARWTGASTAAREARALPNSSGIAMPLPCDREAACQCQSTARRSCKRNSRLGGILSPR